MMVLASAWLSGLDQLYYYAGLGLLKMTQPLLLLTLLFSTNFLVNQLSSQPD